MSEEYPSETEHELPAGLKMDAFIPLVLLCVSFIILLGWQVKMSATQKNLMENAITRQEPAVNQSEQVQASVTKLVTDLLQAAQTDDGAKAIVTKYKIQQAAPAASPAP
jgi:uncharacterized protein YigA (DUF484 family)